MPVKKVVKRKPGRPKKNTEEKLPALSRDNSFQIIDINKAIELRVKGLTYQEIAEYFGCTPQAVNQRLQPFMIDPDLQVFKDNRSEIFANIQWQLLKSIDKKDIKRTPVTSRITGAAILYDKERLETDKSTSNVHLYHDLSRDVTDLDRELKVLGEALGEDVIDGEYEDVDE